ncbi:MAG TPA: YqaJ viral recombinase family protein [Peptostreptococcaceae bacterium]|nr:YqaJ viral recombinase family protein [Peptostreptococcaceae bacterium]
MKRFLDANIIANTNKMTKEEWLKLRKKGIGGSDAGAILGVNQYKSSLSIYLDKTSEDINDDENFRMKVGNKLKKFVAKEFTNVTGKKVRAINKMLVSDEYPFAIANIDRKIVGEKSFLLCKVTNSFSKKDWNNNIPKNYEVQCQHYMGVTGATHCYIAVLIGNEELVIHNIVRDDIYIDNLMKLEKEFWENNVLGDVIPLPDGSSEYSNYLKEKYKDTKYESVNLFISDEKIQKHDDINKNIKKLEIEKKTIEQEIQSEMGEYEIAYIGDRKITWKTQTKNIIDTKLFKKDYPDIASKYSKESVSRVFKIN